MGEYTRELQVATELAQQGGAMIRDELHRQGGPRPLDGATAPVDMEVERLIRAGLAAAFPLDGFCGEESASRYDGPARRVWFVDPNDGTADFMESERGSAVSVGLVVDGVPVLGVVFSPTAPDDGGDLVSWAEGEPLRRNGAAVERDPLPPVLDALHVVVCTRAAAEARYLAWNESLASPARVLARPSVAMRLALVAVGEGDAAISAGPCQPWDVAAGHALLRAVGGTVVDDRGAPLAYRAWRSTAVHAGHPRVALGLARARPHVSGSSPATVAQEGPYPKARGRHGLKVRDAGVLARAQGALLGQVAGDALGQLVEFQPAERIRQAFPGGVRELVDGGTYDTLAGQPTDDSEMALMLARSILRAGRYEPAAALEAYQHWLASRPFDVGTTTRRGLSGSPDASSEANGSLMRVSTLAVHLWGHTLDEAAAVAAQDARLTHPGKACVDATGVFAAAVALAVRAPMSPGELYRRIAAWVRSRGDLHGSVREIFASDEVAPVEDFQTHMGWVRIALRNAFHRLLTAGSVEEAVVATVAEGGDTDTNAAIAGALMGAVHGREGVPARWRRLVLTCRATHGGQVRPPPMWADDLLTIAEQLVALGARFSARARAGGAPALALTGAVGPRG